MFVQLHRGVLDLATMKFVDQATNKCKKHPHGFVGQERVLGFWKALRANLLPHRLRFTQEHVHCEHCFDSVPHLELLF